MSPRPNEEIIAMAVVNSGDTSGANRGIGARQRAWQPAACGGKREQEGGIVQPGRRATQQGLFQRQRGSELP
jgi:hypothetical protein